MFSKKFLKVFRALKSPRLLMSLVTMLVLAAIIYLSRHELVRAWELLGRANIWLLLLLIPMQIIVYYAGGEMIFCYLRDKKLIRHVSRTEQIRIALELNLVNHIFPSGGVSGISYTTWRMHKLGVNTARSTFAQLLRYVTGFLSMLGLMVVAVLFLAIDGQINRYIVAASFLLVVIVLSATFALMHMFSSRRRTHKVAKWIAVALNRVVCLVTFGVQKEFVRAERVDAFFSAMHDDFSELMKEKHLTVKPLTWGVVYALGDIAMFMLAFWALDTTVNPAVLLIGYIAAGFAGLIIFTPGGAGAYEAVMIIFLSMTGTPPDIAIAGIVLTRVILLMGTIIFGYIFYQHALLKYGKRNGTKV